MLKKLKTRRAKLLKEAEALKGQDGQFADDESRAAFDAKMAEVDAVDVQIRASDEDVQSSEYIREEPVTRRRASADSEDADDEHEPNDRDRGVDAENDRVNGILDACEAARLPKSFARKLISNKKMTLLECQRAIFKELRGREEPTDSAPNGGARGTSVEFGPDPFLHKRKGIEDALLHRVNPDRFKLSEDGREYRGMSLLDVAKVYLNARGMRTTDMSRMDIAGVALGLVQRGGLHSTSDFPLLLADVANKSLRADYEAAPQTFGPITRNTTVPDFKTANRVQIGDAPSLKPVNQHGEFTRGTIEEGREQIQAATYGVMFGITRQALVNDDLDAFSRTPQKFGRMARNLESDLAWYQILKNANMADSNALFSAAHLNYMGAGDIDIIPMTNAVKAMRLQRGLDGTTLISAPPKFLIVPPSKEVQALQFVANITPATYTNVNPFAGMFTVVVEPRLETGITIGENTATGSATAWYLAADKAAIDILELAFLEGQSGPVIESRVGFDVDGLEIKCRHDVGAKVIDWRGLFKSDGSDNS